MQPVDFSTYIVLYNFVIGLLLMLSSEKIGAYAGGLIKYSREKTVRLTYLTVFTFGLCVAALSAGIYVFFHLLRISV